VRTVRPPRSSGSSRTERPGDRRAQLERARITLGERSIEVEYLSEFGDAAERLVGAAHDAEFLVVASRDHGFFARLFSAPVDEEVARHADRDVVLVH
jgi:nucleotide-binding universal stress UspA family protein